MIPVECCLTTLNSGEFKFSTHVSFYAGAMAGRDIFGRAIIGYGTEE
jgi:hypothetical protein